MPIALNVPTNWDDAIIDEIRNINTSQEYPVKIKQLYGAVLTNIGGGRVSAPNLQNSQIKSHIDAAHKLGLNFNFLLNAPSIGGIEINKRDWAGLIRTIKWVEEMGADIVTISNPFIGELVSHNSDKLKIKIFTQHLDLTQLL